MIDEHSVLRSKIEEAFKNGNANFFLFDHCPNKNYEHFLTVENNCGVFFYFHQKYTEEQGFVSAEITATEFKKLVYEDYEKNDHKQVNLRLL